MPLCLYEFLLLRKGATIHPRPQPAQTKPRNVAWRTILPPRHGPRKLICRKRSRRRRAGRRWRVYIRAAAAFRLGVKGGSATSGKSPAPSERATEVPQKRSLEISRLGRRIYPYRKQDVWVTGGAGLGVWQSLSLFASSWVYVLR